MIKMKIFSFLDNIGNLWAKAKKCVLDIKDFFYDQKQELKSSFQRLQKNLKDLRSTNLKLAIYHMEKGNIGDAIIRLKIIDLLISSNDPEVFSNIAWCYFLRGDKKNALQYLNKIDQKDDIFDLKNFLMDPNVEKIGDKILDEYRRISAELYLKKWQNDSVYLPKLFVTSLFEHIDELPAQCRILDIGCAAGLIAVEIDNKLEKNYNIIGVDNIKELTKYAKQGKRQLYDNLVDLSVNDFLSKKHQEKYDIITSFCSLDFRRDLTDFFKTIKDILAKNGYFAFMLQTDDSDYLNLKNNNFVYRDEDIKKQLRLAKFEILSINSWRQNRNSSYSIFIVK